MKHFPLIAAITFVLVALLLGISNTVFGAAGRYTIYLPLTTQADNDPTTQPTTEPTTQPTVPGAFFLPFDINGINNTTDASIALDPAGGVHVTYGTVPHNYAIYSYCAANCIDESKFSAVRFGGTATDERISDVTLSLDPAGHPRMLWSTGAGWQYAACDSDCTEGASWTATVIAPLGEAIHSQRFVIDKQGRAHVIDHGDYYETYYITCATDCTDATNWTRTQISTAAFSKPALAVTATGQPRFVFQTYDFGDESQGSNTNRLGYASCDSDCTVATNWSTSVRFSEVDPYDGSWSLTLDPQERPRVALAPWRAYGGDTAANQLYYMWCNAACSNAANSWDKTLLASPDQTISSVDVVLDNANRPQMSFAFSNGEAAQRGIYHARCVTNCESDDGTWESDILDSTEALNESEPVTNTSICSNPINPTWALGWTSALALDSSGQAHIVYDARHLWTCYSNGNVSVQRDINWTRYAPAK